MYKKLASVKLNLPCIINQWSCEYCSQFVVCCNVLLDHCLAELLTEPLYELLLCVCWCRCSRWQGRKWGWWSQLMSCCCHPMPIYCSSPLSSTGLMSWSRVLDMVSACSNSLCSVRALNGQWGRVTVYSVSTSVFEWNLMLISTNLIRSSPGLLCKLSSCSIIRY